MTIRGGSADGRTPAGIDVTGDGVAAGPRRLTGPAGGAAARRAGGDHAGQQPQRVDVDALARPRARQLLRRRARLERAGREGRADDRARRALHRPHHAAAHRHVHLPHAPARLPAAVVGPLRSARRRRARRDLRPGHRSRRRARPPRRLAGLGDPEGRRVRRDRWRARAALDAGRRRRATASA